MNRFTIKELTLKTMLFSILALCFHIQNACADDYVWSGAGDDNLWHNPDNWIPDTGAPTNQLDKATFNDSVASPISVSFGRNNTNGTLVISGVDVLFDMLGYTNTLMVPNSSIGYGSNKTGTLQVKNGEFNSLRNPEGGSAYHTYVASSQNSTGKLHLTGSNTLFYSNTRLHIANATGSNGELLLDDGATLKVDQTGGTAVFYPGNGSGYCRVVVSNANLLTSATFNMSLTAQAVSEVLFTGSNTVWTQEGSVFVGSVGKADMILDGVTAIPSYLHLYIGCAATSTSTVTLVGSSMGRKENGDSTTMSMTLGRSVRVNVGTEEPPEPEKGGVGTLSLLDGSEIKGHSSGTASTFYVYIGPGCTLRIRDSVFDWDNISTANRRIQPFWFTPGSRYVLELTDKSREFASRSAFVYSNADYKTSNVNRISEDADFELVLTESYTHEPGTVFNIFDYKGELEGEFDGLPDGSEFFVDNNRFSIDYGLKTQASAITIKALAPLGTALLVR